MTQKTFDEINSQDYSADLKTREGGKDKETGEIIKLSYLSWATAHKIMKSLDPEAEIIEHEFPHHGVVSGQHSDFLVTENKPFRQVGEGYMVRVSVVLFEKVETENYPVLNYRGQAVANPSANDVNKALKRAFVKALAKHGVALYIYEGEDLPEQPKIDVKEIDILEKLLASINDKTGKDNKNTLINTVNKYTKADSRYGKQIKDISDMTYDQSGLFKIALNKIGIAFDKEQKAKK